MWTCASPSTGVRCVVCAASGIDQPDQLPGPRQGKASEGGSPKAGKPKASLTQVQQELLPWAEGMGGSPSGL
jgi:hypothetical protein